MHLVLLSPGALRLRWGHACALFFLCCSAAEAPRPPLYPPRPPLPAGPSSAVILEVGGMKCGGCSAAVKRILLQQPGVLGAAVNLLTETAVVQVAAGDATAGTAQQQGGSSSGGSSRSVVEQAAEALTSKGFPAKLRVADSGLQGTSDELTQKKEDELKRR